MDRRRAGSHTHAVASSLPHDLRVLQVQLLHAGHYDAITSLPGGSNGRRHLVVFPFCLCQLTDDLHQVAVVCHLQAAALAQRFKEQTPRQPYFHLCHAAAQINGAGCRTLNIFALGQRCQAWRQCTDTCQLGRSLADLLVQSAADGVFTRQRIYPFGKKNIQFP